MGGIAITGASGLVGAAVFQASITAGSRAAGMRSSTACDEIRALYNSSPRGLTDYLHGPSGLNVGVDARKVDVLDRDALRTAFAGIEVVYHCAAHVSTDARQGEHTLRVNVEGTRNVIDACRHAGVARLVHVSSVHALSQNPLGARLDEARPLIRAAHVSPYVRSKAMAELLVIDAARDGLDAVIVCPSGVMGPFDYRPSQTGQLLFDLHAGRLPALLPGGHDWVDSRDVALGAIAAAERGRRGHRYILAGQWATLSDLARHVMACGGAARRPVVMPLVVARVAARAAEWYTRVTHRSLALNREAVSVLQRSNPTMSWAKAEHELGYAPRPLAETIRDTLRWGIDAGMARGPAASR